MSDFRMIQRAHLVPPSEPMRVSMDEERMADLKRSIRDVGVLQALLVFPSHVQVETTVQEFMDDSAPETRLRTVMYEIIDGHRRYVATEDLPEEFLPCRVFDSAEEARYAMMLDATMCHEDFTPAEEGQQFVELANKHGWTLEQLCTKFRKSESYINGRVILVTKDPRIQAAVNARQINIAQAHELLHEKDAERRGTRLLLCIEHGYNARELKAMRTNLEVERQVTETGTTVYMPENAVPPPATEQPECEWCGPVTDPENLRQLWCHWYHLRELRSVVNQVGARNLLGAAPAPVKEQ